MRFQSKQFKNNKDQTIIYFLFTFHVTNFFLKKVPKYVKYMWDPIEIVKSFFNRFNSLKIIKYIKKKSSHAIFLK